MSDRDAVLFANEAFYQAFASRDLDAMADVWAHERPVACLHPGWPPMHGRDQVMASWRAILGHENAPRIVCRDARVNLQGDVAVVICFEELDGQYLIATNLFVREGGPWRIVHHHAGPTTGEPDAEEEGEPTVN